MDTKRVELERKGKRVAVILRQLPHDVPAIVGKKLARADNQEVK